MRVKAGDDRLEDNAVFKTYSIDVMHRSEEHGEQIHVYGSERLRDLLVTLLDNHFRDRPTTNAYAAVAGEEVDE